MNFETGSVSRTFPSSIIIRTAVPTTGFVIDAIRKTAQWANTNQAAAATILERVSKIPAATVGQMNRVVFGETLDVATIQPVIDATAQYKFIAKTFPVADMFWSQAKNPS